ncbi:ORF6N domain-containing protein [Clostridium botulinum]|nr:ORF6N domain-containing protein [Clostridium botulinum]
MDNITVINDNQLIIKEYKGHRVVTLWDIANLHHREVKNIRNNFDRNMKYMLEDEDYFLAKKDSDFARTLSTSGEVTPQALNASKNIPIFTESGYLLMTKPMEDKLSWQVQRQLVNSYFKLKEVSEEIQKTGAYITNKANPEVLRAKADEIESLSVVNETLKIVMDRIDKIPVAEESKVLVMKGILRKAGVEIPIDVTSEQKYYDSIQIAREVCIYSNSGKPHSQAVNAILSKIEILDNEKKDVWETNGSWQGTVTKYTKDVIRKVQKWILDNNSPTEIKNKKKTFRVKYKSLEEVTICQ